MAIKPVQQGKVSVFWKFGQVANGGTVVQIDDANDGYVKLVESGGTVYGLLAQDVVAEDYQEWKLDSVTQRARVSGNVGVYYNGGEYILTSDSYSGNITRGAKLYPNASGILTLQAGAVDPNMDAVAIAETAGNSANGDSIRIKLLV